MSRYGRCRCCQRKWHQIHMALGRSCPACGALCIDEDGSFEELFSVFERSSAAAARAIASPLTGMIADVQVSSGLLGESDFGNN